MRAPIGPRAVQPSFYGWLFLFVVSVTSAILLSALVKFKEGADANAEWRQTWAGTTTSSLTAETWVKVGLPAFAYLMVGCMYLSAFNDGLLVDVFEERSQGSPVKETAKSAATTGGVVCALILGCLLGLLTANPGERDDLRAQWYTCVVMTGISSATYGVAVSSLSLLYLEGLDDDAAESMLTACPFSVASINNCGLLACKDILFSSVLYCWMKFGDFQFIWQLIFTCLFIGISVISKWKKLSNWKNPAIDDATREQRANQLDNGNLAPRASSVKVKVAAS